MNRFDYWFPPKPNLELISPRLAEFYEQNTVYHDMTRSGDKTGHPQVRFLTCLLEPNAKYAEVGCGGGDVCRVVAETAIVYGFDVSPIAITHARQLCGGRPCKFECCSANKLPLGDNSVDGCYSFEVLEHLWDPIAAVKEMIRITKPNGFILLSMPCRFSLDLHLRKHIPGRCLDFVFAGWRYVCDKYSGVPFENIEPDLDRNIYPDCDMITAVIPANFARTVNSLGCVVDFWDTTYMCAHRQDSTTTLEFQRNTERPFFRNFGDHLLLLAIKK